jgi:3-oxoacyl-[acyl-carrier protein] reductase
MKNKTALITGAGKGIGRAIAIELAKENYNIIIHYKASQEKALETKEMCEKYSEKVMVMQADITKSDQVQSMVEAIINEFETIEVVVNNAGITKDNLLLRMSEMEFDQVIDANLKGTFNVVKSVSKPMFKAKYGRIINISSVIGLVGNIAQVNYAASKAGIIGLSKSVAKELAGKNVTCNVIAPGYIETDMTEKLSDSIKETIRNNVPLKRLGSAEDVAHAVVFLASDRASYITGQVLVVDGGLVL